MLTTILKEDFHWTDKQIKAFYDLLEVTGVKTHIDAAIEAKKPETKRDWVSAIDEVLQIYFFPRISENVVNKNLFFPYIEVLTGKNYVAPQERVGLPDVDLEPIEKTINDFTQAIAELNTVEWPSKSTDADHTALEAVVLLSSLDRIPFDTFLKITEYESNAKKLLIEFQSVDKDILRSDINIREKVVRDLSFIKNLFDSNKIDLKKRLEEKQKAIQFLKKVHQALCDFGTYEAAPLNIDPTGNSVVILLVYGAYAFRVIKRVKHANLIRENLVEKGILIERAILPSGIRKLEKTHDLDVLENEGYAFSKTRPPETELQMMQIVTQKSLTGIQIIPINAPARMLGNKKDVDAILQNQVLSVQQKEEEIAKLTKEIRPDTTFTIVYVGFELMHMVNSKEITDGQKIILVGVTEAPYFGQFKVQTETGLEMAGLPQEIEVELQITGPGLEKSYNTKAILDGLGSAVTAQFYWMKQRPHLDKKLERKLQLEPASIAAENALSAA